MSDQDFSIKRPKGLRTVVIFLVLAGLYFAWSGLFVSEPMFQILLSDIDLENINHFDKTTRFCGPTTGIILDPIFDLIGWFYLYLLAAIFNFSIGIITIASSIGLWERKRWSFLPLVFVISIELLINLLMLLDKLSYDLTFGINALVIGFFALTLYYINTKSVKIFINRKHS